MSATNTAKPSNLQHYKMKTLDSFTKAYIEAALWNSTDDGGEPMDKNYSASDIVPATFDKMVADCAKFQAENETPDYGHSEYSDAEMAGHDFWLTRNRHGAGFWDSDIDKTLSQKLTEASHAFGSFDLYIGDDKQVYDSSL